MANSYLEGHYSEIYPNVSLDEEGMSRPCKQFSFPGGISSHVAPETPGSINEGGELGYSIAHAFGSVFDNPNLITTCIVGDGEAETGPLATAWHSNKFLNPVTDGAVLPILHLNGYKISNPTVFARISKDEVKSFFHGCGWDPIFVEASPDTDHMEVHHAMAAALDKCIEKIQKIQRDARKNGKTERPFWPMIVLRTPKGWTGPKFNDDGLPIENSFRAHQVPIDLTKPDPNEAKHMKELGNYIRDVLKLNEDNKNFRIFGPDESMSNRLYAAFEATNRDFNAEILPTDDKLAHDGFTHQDPGFLDHISNKKADVVRMYLPPDTNCLLSTFDHCIKSKNYVNVIVASKHPSCQWLTMDQAVKHCTQGIGIWDWASNDKGQEPDLIMACCGDTQHPHGLSESEYNALFTKDKPIIFAFHGYPKLVHELTYLRENRNLHVYGYHEEGTITTPFDMRVQNKIDRFDLVKAALQYLPQLGNKASHLVQQMNDTLVAHKQHISELGEDLPEVVNWKWHTPETK